jgi:hypothetical protein
MQISKISDMFSLTLDQGEATYLTRENLNLRRDRIQNSYSPDGLASLRKRVDEYIAGKRELTAMEFYLAFEQASVLVLFHAFPDAESATGTRTVCNRLMATTSG